MRIRRKIKTRTIDPEAYDKLESLPDVLRRLYAARGVGDISEIDYSLNSLLSPQSLLGVEQAAECLTDAIEARQKLLVVGDFDADGATSTALCVSALKQFGAHSVNFLVPNRFEYGYGLSPEIVEVAHKIHSPDWIITVDNGIANHLGVDVARSFGINVCITDHHLPAETLPNANVIVNPNLSECDFPSKSLAGVGVIFYVMLALRRTLIERGWFDRAHLEVPNMAQHLDLVALGTVADVVPLDRNNRILVAEGLKRMRHGQMRTGLKALLDVAGRDHARLTARDLGFAIGPRLNAAGRLEDMTIGISCLLADNPLIAKQYAQTLQELNEKRKRIESEMKDDAYVELDHLFDTGAIPHAIALYDASWHQGVIGILAGRIKEKYLRPTIVFADGDEGEIKGSARSVPGLHIRDVLAEIAACEPNLLKKFGGHAMAAGLTIPKNGYEMFQRLFDTIVKGKMSIEELEGEIFCDGPLRPDELNLKTVAILDDAGPFGQNFPAPQFCNTFIVESVKIVGEYHLRLMVKPPEGNRAICGIWFNADLSFAKLERGDEVEILYDIAKNEYQGYQSVQLMVQHVMHADVTELEV